MMQLDDGMHSPRRDAGRCPASASRASAARRAGRRPEIGITKAPAPDGRPSHTVPFEQPTMTISSAALARAISTRRCAGLDAAIPAGRLAARIFQQIRPMAVDLHREKPIGQRGRTVQQEDENAAATLEPTGLFSEWHVSEPGASPQPPDQPSAQSDSTSHQTSIIRNCRQR